MSRTQLDDGGAAFPVSTIDGFTNSGMGLRDWFAGQALAGGQLKTELATWELDRLFGPHRTDITRAEIAAAQAYLIADAMLERRTKARGDQP